MIDLPCTPPFFLCFFPRPLLSTVFKPVSVLDSSRDVERLASLIASNNPGGSLCLAVSPRMDGHWGSWHRTIRATLPKLQATVLASDTFAKETDEWQRRGQDISNRAMGRAYSDGGIVMGFV